MMDAIPKAERATSKARVPMRRFVNRKFGIWMFTLAGLWTILLHFYSAPLFRRYPLDSLYIKYVKNGCPFPLPNHLLREQPLQPNEGPLADSSKKLHAFLSERTSHLDIDSLSIAIVTPSGTVYEQSYGILKANETISPRPVTRDSIYRIASITKMFTTLETLILRERGALNLYIFSPPCTFIRLRTETRS